MATSGQKVLGFLLVLIGLLVLFYGPFLWMLGPFGYSLRQLFLNWPSGFDMSHFSLPHGAYFPRLFVMFPLFMLGLTLLISIWVFVDAEKRGMNGWLWGLLAFVGSFIGLIVYLLARSSQPATAPVGSLICPYCSQRVRADFVVCPHCGTSLKPVCPNCRRGIENGWRVCPYCSETLVK
ncbi:MAG: zinc ribbon domain-containing protein [candidate division KSB1 bacterium]|nr:zinc ribbon domain-containing protein [candidate division KSB1 bacterium]MDQ7064396.1 zinc ribbon domain-containing protein [candidate division KSB1 bacterium]